VHLGKVHSVENPPLAIGEKFSPLLGENLTGGFSFIFSGSATNGKTCGKISRRRY
jgi:hypothetical protein